MSTLQVQTLQGPTSGADSNTIRVADNHKLYAKGHVVQVQTYHVGYLVGGIQTTSDAYQESGAKVTITPQFSNSLIVCDFVATMSSIPNSSTGQLITRLLLNSVAYGGYHTTGFVTSSSPTTNSYQPTAFKTVHSNLAAGTPVEFNLQFKSDASGQNVVMVNNQSSITMTVTEIAQ